MPDFAASSRLYMRRLMLFLGASFPPEVYAGARAAAAELHCRGENSLAARASLRGIAHSHREWQVADDGGRTRLRAQWRELFKNVRRGDLPGDADAGLSTLSFA